MTFDLSCKGMRASGGTALVLGTLGLFGGSCAGAPSELPLPPPLQPPPGPTSDPVAAPAGSGPGSGTTDSPPLQLTASRRSYRITAVPTLKTGGTSAAFAINEAGTVVGSAQTP